MRYCDEDDSHVLEFEYENRVNRMYYWFSLF